MRCRSPFGPSRAFACGNPDEYMSVHRKDTDITPAKKYFTAVVDWAAGVFLEIVSEMRGLKWGRLYKMYHKKAYNTATVSTRVQELLGDEYVQDKRGIFEYILNGEADQKLLNIRVFDDKTKRSAYTRQTAEAQKKGISNCPLCAIGPAANKKRIWELSEMDADHVAAWVKGGRTNIDNCQILCRTHNRSKGNR